MSFDWREYVVLAQWLQTNTPPGVSRESACRCAISRAYYAAFGYAINYARDYLGFRPRNDPDDHGRLRGHLKGKKRRKTSECLDRLREWRNGCDCLDDLPGDLDGTLAAALAEAQYVFDSLLPPAPQASSPPEFLADAHSDAVGFEMSDSTRLRPAAVPFSQLKPPNDAIYDGTQK